MKTLKPTGSQSAKRRSKLMKSKETIYILLTAVLLIADDLFAFGISGSVWLVSDNVVSNNELRAKLFNVEMLAKQNDKESALRELRTIKKQDTGKYTYLKDGEYLPLVLDGMELHYFAYLNSNDRKIPDKCHEFLDKYSDVARDKSYSAYKQIFQDLRKYYESINKYKEAIEVQKQQALYAPHDYVSLLPLLNYAGTMPQECGPLDDFIEDYVKKGGVLYEDLKLAAIMTSEDNSITKMAKACEWLSQNTRSSEKVLSRALSSITMLADLKQPQTLIDYYYALTNLALKQPSTEERLTVFSIAINERQKLVTAAPEILPPK